MAKIVITNAKLKALRPKAERYHYSELLDRGLYLRVYPSGRKTWMYRYKVAGRPAWLALGEFGEGKGYLSLAQARAELEVRRKQAEAAREGLAPEPRHIEATAKAERLAEPTVADIATRWLRAPGKRGPKAPATVAEYRRMLDRDVLPSIGALRVAHVTDKHLRAVLDKIAERAKPVAESETHKMLRAMFTHAVETGALAISPAERIKFAPAERRKDRNLSDAELRAFLALLADNKTRVGKSTELCLLWVLVTACRPGEARGTRWGEIDERAGTWTIPGRRTKNGRERVVTLSDAALGLLTEARALAEKHPFVFPGLTEDKPLSDQALSHAVRRLRERLAEAGLSEAFTPHDLRRTAATIVAGRLAFGRFIASQILGHVSETEAGVTAIYDRHDYAPERARAWHALGEYVAALRAGKAPKVRALSEARGHKAPARAR